MPRLLAATLTYAAATVLVAGCAAAAPATSTRSAPAGVPLVHATVIATLPHDTSAFTEGLQLVDGVLYESTGLEGHSQLRATDPDTGTVRRSIDLPADWFGEGLAVVGPTLWQLTWRNGVAVHRDLATFAETGRARFTGEGWGLCYDGSRLVMSDGTDRLTFRDPITFAETGGVDVRADGRPVTMLNELECVGGQVYANVWQTDQLVRIDPGSGAVTARVDLTGLLPADLRAGVDVLNGIAAVPGTHEFLVTGKLWPRTFRVRFG